MRQITTEKCIVEAQEIWEVPPPYMHVLHFRVYRLMTRN